jgi:copper chaperone CopZ
MKSKIFSALVLVSLFSIQALACDEKHSERAAHGAAASAGHPSLTLVDSTSMSQAAPGSQKAVFQVKGMMCQSCEKKIQASLKKLEGVNSVTFHKKNAQGIRLAEVSLAAGSKVTPVELMKAVEDAGYSATSVQ